MLLLGLMAGCASSAPGEEVVGSRALADKGGPGIEMGGVKGGTAMDAIQSYLDNPWGGMAGIKLVDVPTEWNGPMPQEIHSDYRARGSINYNGDFLLRATGGEVRGDGGKYFREGSVDGEFTLWPAADGRFTAGESGAESVPLRSYGIRFGYVPQTYQAFTVLPSGEPVPLSKEVTASLHPSVALVPVQVAVMYSDENEMTSVRLDQQLSLWDSVPVIKTSRTTQPTGEISIVRHTFGRWPETIQSGPRAGLVEVDNNITPDSALASCGVQFRLVNFMRVKTVPRDQIPRRSEVSSALTEDAYPMNTTDDAACRSNRATVTADKAYIPGVPLIIFTAKPGFADSRETGRALMGQDTACMSMSSSGSTVLVHELGHMSGMDDCSGGSGCKLMNSLGGASLPATERECSEVHKWATNHAEFFKR